MSLTVLLQFRDRNSRPLSPFPVRLTHGYLARYYYPKWGEGVAYDAGPAARLARRLWLDCGRWKE